MTRPTPRLLALGTVATVGSSRREIVRRAGTDANPIVRFEGVSDRAAIELLRGEEIMIAAGELPALDEGEFWAHELEGCTVVAAAGAPARAIGVVQRLVELPSCEALEVERPGGAGTLLVPMVKDAVLDVDLATRTIEVDAAFLDVEDREPGGGA